jgi:hypothetical protein
MKPPYTALASAHGDRLAGAHGGRLASAHGGRPATDGAGREGHVKSSRRGSTDAERRQRGFMLSVELDGQVEGLSANVRSCSIAPRTRPAVLERHTRKH